MLRICFFYLFFCVNSLQAQQPVVTLKNHGFSIFPFPAYYVDGKWSPQQKEIASVLASKPLAYAKYNQAKRKNNIALACTLISTGTLAYMAFSPKVTGTNKILGFSAISSVFVTAAIVLDVKAFKQHKQTVELYKFNN
jgi:hypothetical protein